MTEVTFFTEFEELKLSLPPVPSREFWPEWFKNQRGNWEAEDGTKRMTVKSCPGILDVLCYGYIIPLWSDYMVVRVSPTRENSNRHIGWRLPEGNDDKFFAGSHSGDQIDSYPFPPDTFHGTFKLVNPWSIRTSPGYSCYITAPHYNKHPNLTTLSGIVDTDIYHEAHINTWFTAPLEEEIILPYGMPVAQIIPFKREEFEMKTEVGDHRTMINKMTQFVHKSKFAKQHYRKKLMINRYK
tara:strand:+ start:120 stop:839 length:720 start_codon:yes stop_codon:yes gene_type:complete